MDYIFTNGTDVQKQLWLQAASFLRSLPGDAMPLVITVSFNPPSEIGQTNFAETITTLGDANSVTKVRNDAPGFGGLDASLIAEAASRGLKYDAHRHFNETAIHELGHSVFASLPSDTRLAILALFGIATDSPDALHPPGSDWHDQPGEAIADTFKEAFLPAQHRVFPNRTNIHLPYSLYPEFRRLIRTALPEVENTGELNPGEVEVPALNLDAFATGEPIAPPFPVANYLAGPSGKHGIWSTTFGNFESGAGLHNSQTSSGMKFEGWVKDGTVLTYSFIVTPDLFTDPYFEPESVQQYNDSGIQWILIKRPFPGGPEEIVHRAIWAKSLAPPPESEFPGDVEGAGGFLLFYEAMGGGAPPALFTASLVVSAANFTATRVCRGVVYRFVTLLGGPACNLTEQFPETVPEHERLRDFYLYRWIPSLSISQAVCAPGAGGRGELVIPPGGSVRPSGARAGRVRKPGRIIGRSG